jgi:hypothetical protein
LLVPERYFEQILELYPEADLYSLIDFLSEDMRVRLQGKNAERFGVSRFRREFSEFMEQATRKP